MAKSGSVDVEDRQYDPDDDHNFPISMLFSQKFFQTPRLQRIYRLKMLMQ